MTEDQETPDFSEFAPSPTTGDMKVLSELVQRAAEIKEGLKKLEDRSKIGEDLLKDLLEVQIPELLQNSGMKPGDKVSFGGITVELKSDVYCNIPAMSSIDKERDPDRRRELSDRRNKGLAYIEREAPSLIKRKYEIELDRDSQDAALLLESKIAEMENPPEFTQGRTVHPQTLAKWIKEKQDQGHEFSEEIKEVLGYFPRRVAKITK